MTGVGRRQRGTRWSAPICFWRDIFEPYILPYMPRGWFEFSNGILYIHKHSLGESMKFDTSMFSDKPTCMPLCFGIVERRCNHIAKTKGYPWPGLFFFSLGSLSYFSSFLASSSTFSSFLLGSVFSSAGLGSVFSPAGLGSVFSPAGLCNGRLVVSVVV